MKEMRCSLLFLLPLVQIATSSVLRRQARELKDVCNKLQVSIIVSSLNENDIPRQLIISWQHASPTDGDWIGLFDTDPSGSDFNANSSLHVVYPKNSTGWQVTNINEKATVSNDLGFTKKCLGFWVAYINLDGTIMSSSCLKTEPTWMNDMKDEISPLQLRHIFLPGTHDSGSYKEYNPLEGSFLIFKYTITQEEDTLSQLVNGIRYLDIRVGYYENSPEKWMVNHGVFSIHPLKTIFDDVKKFIENTNEIIILDFHEFPAGFGKGLEVHNKLVEYLREELGQYAAPSTLTWNAKLSDIWALGKRIILSYNERTVAQNNELLWHAVSQKWGNVRTLVDLYDYLSKVMASPPTDVGWSAMAELTPNTMDVLQDTFGGLRKMADMVNHNVTIWYNGIWGQTINIVAADYFRGTNLVDSAITWNHRRAQKLKCDARK